MKVSSAVFLDAKVLEYPLDSSSELNKITVEIIYGLLNDKVTLCTSHHVIEEVLRITQKIIVG
jgi:predicted nucleic acid-binding protein